MADTPLLQQWFKEVWHNADETAIDKLLHPDAVIHGLEIDKAKTGPGAFKPFYKGFREIFPVVHIEAQPIFGNSEYEAADCIITGRNAEGRNIRFTGLVIARFKDGKLLEGWNGFDFLSMYQQLGFDLRSKE